MAGYATSRRASQLCRQPHVATGRHARRSAASASRTDAASVAPTSRARVVEGPMRLPR